MNRATSPRLAFHLSSFGSSAPLDISVIASMDTFSICDPHKSYSTDTTSTAEIDSTAVADPAMLNTGPPVKNIDPMPHPDSLTGHVASFTTTKIRLRAEPLFTMASPGTDLVTIKPPSSVSMLTFLG